MTEISNIDVLDYHHRLILKYNINLATRTINIVGDISESTFVRLDKALSILEDKMDPISIYINSFGGDVWAGLAIVDRIQQSPCKITTIGTGVVASMAIPILASGTAERGVTKNTSLMYHGIMTSRPLLKLPEHDSEHKHDKQLQQRIHKFMASVTKKPYSFWASCGKHTDHWFDIDQAYDYGLIDYV